MIDKLLPVLFFSLFLGTSIIELMSDTPQPSSQSIEKEIPETKMTLPVSNMPTILIQYCHSCGYQKAFMDYASILQEKYPHIKVEGEYYEPGGIYLILARIFGFARMAFIALIVLEYNIFVTMGLGEPRVWRWCLNNKIYSCLLLFFVCNMFENMLVSSGAFEISLNGVPLWSKIESGRVPQAHELFRIIDAQTMNFKSKIEINPMFPE